MRYFLTGGTGFIGGYVARALRRAGHDVVALVRDARRASSLTALGVELREGDVTRKESMGAAMSEVDGVFHVAGWYKIGAKHPEEGMRINVDGTRNVLELMAEHGIPKGVYTSTLGVFSDTKGQLVDETYRHDGPWLSAYDRSKWLAHYEVAEPMVRRGLPLAIVLPGVTYGPGDTSEIRPLFVRYLQGRLRALPSGTAFCWAHVEDIARGHVLAMERGRSGESYILGGPAHTLVEAFEVAERITGIPAPRFRASPGLLRLLAAVSHSERLRVSAGVTYLGRNDKARRDLGYDPRPLEVGLRETLAYEAEQLGISVPALRP